MIQAVDISFRYPDALDDVISNFDIKIEPGEIVHLTGVNGSGKTTLLKLLSGELEPTKGRVIRKASNRSIYLDQNAAAILAPNLSFYDHLKAFVCGEDIDKTMNFVAHFEAVRKDKTDAFVGLLSGGQKQIFALAMALSGQYEVVFLDEFTAHLDKESELMAYRLLETAIKSLSLTVAIVSHTTPKILPTKTVTI